MSLIIRDARTNALFELFDNFFSPPYKNGNGTAIHIVSSVVPLLPGHYSVDVWFGDRLSHCLDLVQNAVEFDVVATQKSETSLALTGPFKCGSTWELL